MTISIRDYNYKISDETHNHYEVTFHGKEIHTLVTATPYMVDAWISRTESIHRLVVGLDVEWRPSFDRNVQNPVATIQLCVGRRCLIFQPIHAPFIPRSLVNFLLNDCYTFVGVGIDNDVEKIVGNYELWVSRPVDLCRLAADKLNKSELRNAGLKNLASVVLGKEVDKPRNVTLSSWDKKWLTLEQVTYVCVDAFVSFEIGRALEAWRC